MSNNKFLFFKSYFPSILLLIFSGWQHPRCTIYQSQVRKAERTYFSVFQQIYLLHNNITVYIPTRFSTETVGLPQTTVKTIVYIYSSRHNIDRTLWPVGKYCGDLAAYEALSPRHYLIYRLSPHMYIHFARIAIWKFNTLLA